MNNRIYPFLGLAAKAGNLISGGEACERAVKNGKTCLIIVAEDAANNMKIRFKNMCKHRGVDIRIFGKRELLGKYTGKDMRVVIGIVQEGFAKQLLKMIDNQKLGIGGV
ncbi:MAG TPA: 50S ribosomal protein L7ae [Clostridiaceae bacterium]|jgi:ribosomal protein L7Ae-like RNA K-turn-binding protein|nr:50S ribosomal protein L7ae [Clostridiaceae bacterium]